MKQKIAFLVFVLIFLPIGITGSGSDISSIKFPISFIPFRPSPGTLQTFSIGNFLQESSPKLSEMGSLAIMPLADETINLFGLVELDIQTNLSAANPYNPSELDLEVSFRAPSGNEVQVGAFWYQGFDPTTRLPTGEPGWKVRYTPDEVGEWSAVAYAPALGLHSTPISFTVQSSGNQGFIHIDPKNPRYLAYDNGDFFFPIGVNMAWWSDGRNPLAQYNKWLKAFSSNGGNTIRVWMASWSFGIEWKDSGLGNYDQRQYEAWLLDQLFKLADQYDVKIILVLINHGAFSEEVNSEWKDNPYNSALGGPLDTPEQFVSDPLAKTYFQRRLNYIINRWGYSTSLLAWEWFNEVNLTPISDAALLPWLNEMTSFLQAIDINHHLTTSSFAMRTQSWIWQLPGLDIVQAHEYSSHSDESEHDLAGRAAQEIQDLEASVPKKPILMGELGYSAKNYADNIDQTGIHLHNGLWATTFSGYAGSAMYWWWDIYIDANNLWHAYKGLANFLSDEDLAKYQPFSPLQINSPQGAGGQAIGLGLRGENILVWLRSNVYTVQASITARNGKTVSADYLPPLVEGSSITLEDMANGSYTVMWFDPQGAQWLNELVVIAQNSTLIIPIPPFREDLAAKISRIP